MGRFLNHSKHSQAGVYDMQYARDIVKQQNLKCLIISAHLCMQGIELMNGGKLFKSFSCSLIRLIVRTTERSLLGP
jgi:hypothetical protein